MCALACFAAAAGARRADAVRGNALLCGAREAREAAARRRRRVGEMRSAVANAFGARSGVMLEPGFEATYALAVLGDLHLDPRAMQEHETAREQIVAIWEALDEECAGSIERHVVSVGDLGAYGIAGTTASFELAREYLERFGCGYSVITGNHDLEGLDEFESDRANLLAWGETFRAGNRMAHDELPVFRRTLGNTLDGVELLGLSTTRFRDAAGSSHAVFVDDEQLAWFERQLEAIERAGKRALVFTHAPPMGCGLRVLQSVHIKNKCAWLNHSENARRRRVFLQLVERFGCIKGWFSGHFHLSHDYQDSVSLVHDSCSFVQCGVIGSDSSRDARRQTRFVVGSRTGFRVFSVNHHDGGALRLDASVDFSAESSRESLLLAHPPDNVDPAQWFSAYVPRKEDGCYLELPSGDESHSCDGGGTGDDEMSAAPLAASVARKVCWWHMASGVVLGVHDGMLLEYDEVTLAPLGVVMTAEELDGRDVLLVGDGAVLIVHPPRNGSDVEVVHPNADGSYARTFQLNKRVRIERKARERLARRWLAQSGLVLKQ